MVPLSGIMLIVTAEALGNLFKTLVSISWRALEDVKMSFVGSCSTWPMRLPVSSWGLSMMAFLSDGSRHTKAKWLGFLHVWQSLSHAELCECRGCAPTTP